MPIDPSNPKPAPHAGQQPDHVIDALLASIEADQPLPEHLRSDPRVRAWIEIITDDRKTLQQLAGQDALLRAPADLLGRVEAQLERDALMGLQPQPTAPRADELQVYKLPRARNPIFASPWFRFASVAAGVAVVVGASIIALQLAPTRPGPILAGGNTNDSASSGVFVIPSRTSAPVTAQRATQADALAQAAKRRTHTVIRITTTRPIEQVVAAIERFDGQTGSLVAARAEPAALAAALAATHAVDVARTPIAPGALARDPGRTGFAGLQAGAPNAAQPTTASATAPAPTAPARGEPRSRDTLVVGVNAASDWIEIITNRLDIEGVTVDLIEAPQPVTLAAPPDTAAILWWEQPAATWGPRVGVPVIIDRY
jgi:hypothetical protein